MFEVLTRLFDPTGFPPRKDCGDGWTPALMWLHISSDLFIWLAYLSIPLVLLYFTKRRDLPYPRLFVLFALFILACGTTHLVEAIIFEYPIYRFAGVMKFVTAVVSWVTVIALIPIVPRVMSAVTAASQPGAVTKQHRALPATESEPTRTRGYIVAILAGVLAILVRAAIDPLVQADHIFVVALLAVVYVSWQHGFGPGVASLSVATLGYVYFFVPPRHTLFVQEFGNQLAVALFFFCGVACAALGEAQHTAQRRARVALATAVARGEELESEIARRRVVEAALRQRETELVAAQRESADALARLGAFLDNAPLGIAFFDPELRYVRINAHLAAANGRPVEAHTGRTLQEMVPEFPAEVAEAYRRTAGPDGAPFAAQIRRPDARFAAGWRAWQVNAFPVRDADGTNLGAGVIAQDVTDRLKAEEELRRSERNLADFFENANVGLHWVGPDGRILRANKAELELLGYAREEYIGRPIADFHDDPGTIRDILERLQRGERLDNYPARLRCKDGGTRDVLISSSALWEDGKFVHSRCFTRDVTELKRAEEELRDSEARLRAFYDHSPLCMGIVEPLGDDVRHVYDNRASCEFFGVGPDRTAGRRATELGTPPDVLKLWVDKYRESGERRAAVHFEYEYDAPGGRRWLSAVVSPLDTAGGRPQFCYLAQDVTDRRRGAEELRESEARFRSLADSAPALIWVSETDGRRTYFNKTWVEFTGRSADEQLGDGWADSVHPEDRDRYLEAYAAALAARRPFELEYRLRRRDGAYRWVLARGTPRVTPSGGFAGFVGFCLDVTERREADESVRRSEERFRSLVIATAQIVWTTTPEGQVAADSETWRAYTGQSYDEFAGAGWLSVVHPDDRDRTAAAWRDAVASKGTYAVEYRLRRHDGEYRWNVVRGVPVLEADGRIREWVGTCIDVHDQKVAAERVAEANRFLEATTDALSSHIAVLDPDGLILKVNRAWRRFGEQNGLSTPFYGVGSNYLDACETPCPSSGPLNLADNIRAVISGRATQYQVEYPCHSPTEQRWFLMRVNRFPGDGPVRVVVSHENITPRVLAESAIRESEAFRRSVFENSPDCLMIIDLDGRVLEMNEAGCQLMELDDFGAIRRARWAELWPVANRETIREAVDAARAGRVGRFQGFCPTAKGTAKYWDVSVAAVPSAGGQPYRLIGVSRDVTEQRRAEDTVRASEQRFRTLTEAVPQMVWTADPKGEVTFFNRRWDEYTGVPLETGRASGWSAEIIHPEDAPRFQTGWKLAVAQGAESFSHEFRLRRTDGEYRWMLSAAVSLRDPTGAVSEWVGTLTDIDDQKRQAQTLERMVRERTLALEETNLLLTGEVAERRAAEEQVRSVAAELARSNDELEKFAYIASHDLQEPLRKIQAFGDRLRNKCREQLPENGKEYVDRMLSAAGRMRRLIDDLLTFSRVTTQKKPYKRIDLGRLVREVVSDLDIRIGQANGTVRVGALPDLDADPSQMRQLFQNLIANAVKFHRPDVPPVVDVEGELETPPPDPETGDSVPRYRISVRDNGIGFDEKYRDRIFDVFQRLHGRDEYEGTGVGLAICRKIAERHGGTIAAHSRPGEGATFVVTLPVRQFTHREVNIDDDQSEQTDHDPDGR